MHAPLNFLLEDFLQNKKIADNEIDKMLDDDIIERSSGPWASTILLVKKKDGSIRFCIDYRKLNVVVKKDAYPLPRTGECLEALSGSCVHKFMCTLDLVSGYWNRKLILKIEKKLHLHLIEDCFNLKSHRLV